VTDGPRVAVEAATLVSRKPWPGKGKRWQRMWELEAACGHLLWRHVRYVVTGDRHGVQERSTEDIAPPPEHVFCEGCGTDTDRSNLYSRWKWS
jgi:hypothetical protein